MNKTVEAVWTDLINRAEKEPLPAPGCISGEFDCLYDNVTASQIREWAQQWLFFPVSTFPTLVSAIYVSIIQIICEQRDVSHGPRQLGQASAD